MSKYHDIASLVKEAATHITKNESEWTSYLTTAARLYKYPFKEQMLIYVQRPDATACASIETWNERMNCWVNKGAKGIALIDEDSDRNRLKYVFDVSDVHKARRIGRDPYLWNLQEEQKDSVIAQLEKTYGETNETQPFEMRLIELARNIAEDFYPELIADMDYVKEGSFLDGLDEQNISIRVKETLASSIAYTLLSRCGADMNEWKDELNFDYISDFSNIETVSILGNATTDMSQPILMEIGRTIGAYERNKARNHARGEQIDTHKKNVEKELANGSKINYTALKRESKMRATNNETSQKADTERGTDYEHNIREERGLHDSEPSSERGDRGQHNEIRSDEKELFERSQSRDLHRDVTEGNTQGTPVADSGAGRTENGTLNSSDEQSRGSDRGTQSNRSDDLGSENEQHSPLSRGSSPEGTDLQLGSGSTKPGIENVSGFSFADNSGMDMESPYQQMNLFQSFEEQVGTVAVAHAAMKHTAPVGYAVSDKIIDDILRTGGGREHSKKRIYAKYTQQKTPEEMTAFLQKEYKTTGKGFTIDGNPVSAWFDESGMKIGFGTSAKEMPLVTMGWSDIETRVRAMVEAGDYVSSTEAFLTDSVEKGRIANHYYFFFRDGMDEMPKDLDITYGNYPKSESSLSEQLSTIEGIEHLEGLLDTAMHQLETGEKKLRFRSVMPVEELRAELANLKVEKLEFPLKENVETIQSDFITQDEIDAKLSAGSSFSQGKMRIYEHFKEGHSTKDSIDFLKNEYGTGGGSHAIIGSDNSWEDHDAKGIELKKGDIFAPYAKVLLKWNVVEKRIRQLVNEGKYFSPKGLEEYQAYREEKALQALQKEQAKLESTLEEESTSGQDVQKPEEEITSGHDVQKSEPELKDDFSDINPQEVKEHLESGDTTAVDEMIPVAENVAREYDNEPLEPKIAHVQPIPMTPKIDKTGAKDFHITDVDLGVGSAKDKFRNNVSAIHTLETIEAENRIATPEEQQILSKYVGWGGLADAFDDTKANWASEYKELKELLSHEEYTSARGSTLNAHYTSPTIINSIYDALGNMGFEKGNVLEPAMGIGNFFGMLPEKMQSSKLYGVELDGITGRIARQLYPNADVKISGFEKTDYPNDFFDFAVGNVPFGQYKVADKAYDKNNFLIHDYFFAKTLDKVRPGGVVAFVTSKGTMDKKSEEVRKFLAQRAELLGAVRLPNTAFKANAGTEVTSDILFLKKRDRVMDIEPDWVHLAENEDGISMNQYFAEHPEMIVGKMEMVSGPFGMESTCSANTDRPFAEQLQEAISRIDGTIDVMEMEELEDELASITLLADPNVRNYSYTVVDDKVYYRENSIMKPAEVSDTMEQRIKGMVGIRDCTQELINMQLEEFPDNAINAKQTELNQFYDDFSKKHGLINSQTNKRAFNQDSSYCLLCSLEKLDDEGNFKGKADMFSKRTIKKAEVVTSVDTASEALAVSLGEKAKVDLDFMAELSGKSVEDVTQELAGVIFKNPLTENWETADEYLSGNVRDKLTVAKNMAENHPEYTVNVTALKQVQPKELDASEIEVQIGATWIDPMYINDFMRDVFQTPDYLFARENVNTQYSDVTGQWNIKGKNADYGNTITSMTYGTSRANAYKILEDSLNLKDSRIFDVVIEDGKEKRVLNKKETMLASQKQEAIREAFKDWIFADQERREALCGKYNVLFNSTRPREFEGEHLKFPGMTPDIELKPHQKNAVAHVLYGDNTLLAHCVGAGKTFEMVASAMESKRLGLCQKSLFVVPNHLTEQWASDFLQLYPGANILAATKKDFEPAKRKKFCSRIATGDYDAVIIGHSQFEKIPLSKERQVAIIERQITEIERAIEQTKAEKGERYTIKQMEKTKKSLSTRLEKLNDDTRKDNVVTFEQLGVDRLFVDESHSYKNLFLYTKMRNVAGIAQTEAQKSSDMFAKCQYLDELTGGKGITFATGTPISNSMTELYTNMRYLQYGTLQKLGLGHFDSWAASFGETQTAIELAPEGTGYRAKTRFAKFFNLPELISLFKETADIQTPDMLKLPVPEAEYENVVLKPSDYQKDMVLSLAERAEAVRNRMVQPNEDNMLKITNDGRKLALDQRLINDMLPDDARSKASVCVDKAFEIWDKTKEQKSAQLIFCDLSTPKNDGTFNVYEDIRNKLVEKGVPENEVAFIHEANTETRKAELFAKVRSGQVRFLLGSTAKMGAGTNVQDRLIALHHMDVPWRPSDIEQQEGRILRQGNQNDKVNIFRYVTEGTFDSYSWQLIENKQKFIGQIMTSKSPVRSCEDIDESALSYAEVKALATGNPYIKEKMDLDIQVSKLKLIKANHTSQKYRLEDNIAKHYPQQIAILKERIEGFNKDIATYQENKPLDPEAFSMKIGNVQYADKKDAGVALVAMCKEMTTTNAQVPIGEYMDMKLSVGFDSFNRKFVMNVKGQISHNLELGSDPLGNITRINNTLDAMQGQLEESVQKLGNVEKQLENAKVEVTKPFAQEAELNEKLDRLSGLNSLLNMDEKGDEGIDMDDEEVPEPKKAEKVIKKPVEKGSLKEKLEVMKEKASGIATQKNEPGKFNSQEMAM